MTTASTTPIEPSPSPPPPPPPGKPSYTQVAIQTEKTKTETSISPKAATTIKIEGSKQATFKNNTMPSPTKHFAFAEDMSEYEEEENKGMERARALVIHAVPCHWHVRAVGKSLENRLGEVVGARWLVNKNRRVGKITSSIVVYLRQEVEARKGGRKPITIGGKRCWAVAYDYQQ